MSAVRTYFVLALLVTAFRPGHASSLTGDPQEAQPPTQQQTAPTPSATQGDAEAEDGLSASFDVTAASKYLFQGIDYSDGKPVLQPNLAATFAGFSAVVWSNYQTDLNVVNEIDLSLKYGRTFRRLSVTPGYTYLAYPNRDWDPSQEFFVDFGLEGPLSPSLSLHYDFDAGQGLYATLGLSHEVRAPVTVGANLFYQSQYYEMSGFPAAELKLSGSWSVGAVSLTPQVSHFFTWDNRDFRDAAGIPSTWSFSFNAALPISF